MELKHGNSLTVQVPYVKFRQNMSKDTRTGLFRPLNKMVFKMNYSA